MVNGPGHTARMSVRAPTLSALLALACAPLPAVHADPPGPPPATDAAYARDGVQRGAFVRLETLLADAERRYPGRVIEVEFDDEDDEYEIEILMADGRVAELTYDARTGRLLDSEIDD